MKKIIAKGKWRFYLFLVFALVVYFILPDVIPQEGKLVISTFLFAFFCWVFEEIPLYATSLWIVLFLGLGFSEPSPFFSEFSNPLILLFLGGLVLATTVRKHRIDEFLLSKSIRIAGTNSHAILGCALFISAFFSMWITNTAAAAILLTVYQPLFQQLSKEDPFRKALPLSIALGCNIGGMGTPIGTPPNAIVMGILREYGTQVDFLNWMLMAIPLVFLILVIAFFLLSFLFPSREKNVKIKLEKAPKLTPEGKKTSFIALLMIFFWLTSSWHGISESWIALAGLGIFASFGLITVKDLKKIDWDILLLMWGGLALGIGVEKSQILNPYLPFLNIYREFFIIAIFAFIALLLSTFISNTATANLLLPFAVRIASVEMSLIAIPVALACSLAMSFPISTPSNAIAYSYGTLKIRDLFKVGSIIGIASLFLILAGFKWVIPLFF